MIEDHESAVLDFDKALNKLVVVLFDLETHFKPVHNRHVAISDYECEWLHELGLWLQVSPFKPRATILVRALLARTLEL